ncbi:MAG: hypothetical protein AAF741_15700 [Bacteroidota bacterium]
MPTRKAAPKKKKKEPNQTLLISKLDSDAITAINQAKRYWGETVTTKASLRLIHGYWGLHEELNDTRNKLADLRRTHGLLLEAIDDMRQARETIYGIVEKGRP